MARVIWQENGNTESLKFDTDTDAAKFALRLSQDDGVLCCLNTNDGRLVRYMPKTGAAELVS